MMAFIAMGMFCLTSLDYDARGRITTSLVTSVVITARLVVIVIAFMTVSVISFVSSVILLLIAISPKP